MSAIKGGVGGGRQHIDRDFKKREKRCLFTGSLPELQLISFRSVTQYVKCAHFAALKNFIREEEFFIIASFYTVTFMKEKKIRHILKSHAPQNITGLLETSQDFTGVNRLRFPWRKNNELIQESRDTYFFICKKLRLLYWYQVINHH